MKMNESRLLRGKTLRALTHFFPPYREQKLCLSLHTANMHSAYEIKRASLVIVALNAEPSWQLISYVVPSLHQLHHLLIVCECAKKTFPFSSVSHLSFFFLRAHRAMCVIFGWKSLIWEWISLSPLNWKELIIVIKSCVGSSLSLSLLSFSFFYSTRHIENWNCSIFYGSIKIL